MILLLLALVFLTGILNISYYEYRVMKGPGTPKTLDLTGKRLRF